MASDPKLSIQIDLRLNADHPGLLRGLEYWRQQGLLSDDQLRSIGHRFLNCPRPLEPSVSRPDQAAESASLAAPQPPEKGRTLTRSRTQPALVPLIQALMAEISVVWLLFLGVSLVVVSSVVLAATQWPFLSPRGQYVILLGYTLAFWLAGLWSRRQTNLRTTGRMLQGTTLLIIPINFWVMDSFALRQTAVGLGLSAIAAIGLSVLLWRLLRPCPAWLLWQTWGLSWLHWGWSLPGGGLAMAYLGALGTSGQIWGRSRSARQLPSNNRRLVIYLVLSSLLLVARAGLNETALLSQLGLAVGLLGWGLVRTGQRPIFSSVAPTPWVSGAIAGIGLLGLGWLVSAVSQPGQAIAVSGLGLWLLGQRLPRYWRRLDLVLLIGIGLQTYGQLWRWLPAALITTLINQIGAWVGTPLVGWQLSGLALLPALGLLLLGADWLERRQQPQLTRLTEAIALGLGLVGVLPALEIAIVRSLYLLAGTLLLVGVLRRRSQTPSWLIYFSHGVGLTTLLSIVDTVRPQAALWTWTVVLLGLTLGEWTLAAFSGDHRWQQSHWHLGLGLGAAGYYLLLGWAGGQPAPLTAPAGLIGLGLPAALTTLTGKANFPHRPQAAGIGLGAAIAAPLPVLAAPNSLLLSLGVAAVLAAIISRYWPQRGAAVVTVGLGLGGAAVAAWHYGRPHFGFAPCLALALWGLWGLWVGLRQRSTPLAQHYRAALNGWAIALASSLLLGLVTLGILELGGVWIGEAGIYFRAALLATGAIALALWQTPTHLAYWGLALGTESLVLWGLASSGLPLATLAVMHAALGLLTQLAGDWGIRHWRHRRPSPVRRGSWHGIPLGFVGLAWLQSHTAFTATTGLYTLATAVVALGVGRRHPRLHGLTLLGIVALSLGAYELLIHRLLQTVGGAIGDSLTLLALLAAAIAGVYQGFQTPLQRWWQPWRRRLQRTIPVCAHLHWGLGSGLASIAWLGGFSPGVDWLWGVTLASLIGYAAWQGRTAPAWVYAAVAELVLGLGYGLGQLFSGPWLGAWGPVAAAAIATGLYRLPWSHWGWSPVAWQRSARCLPGLTVLLCAMTITVPSLLLVGAFYAALATVENRVRLSYLSLGLANWAGLKLIVAWSLPSPLGEGTLISAALLYLAQVEPTLQVRDRREQRHWLRLLATFLLCVTAIEQAATQLGPSLLVALLGLGLVLVGLARRVRAYLYIGTLTLGFQVLQLLWLFIRDEALLLWSCGIGVGLGLIWLAATFESRRTQTEALLQHWAQALETWD